MNLAFKEDDLTIIHEFKSTIKAKEFGYSRGALNEAVLGIYTSQRDKGKYKGHKYKNMIWMKLEQYNKIMFQ